MRNFVKALAESFEDPMFTGPLLDNHATVTDLFKHYGQLKYPALRLLRLSPSEVEFIEDTLANWQKKSYADRLAVEFAITFLRSEHVQWPTFMEHVALSVMSPTATT